MMEKMFYIRYRCEKDCDQKRLCDSNFIDCPEENCVLSNRSSGKDVDDAIKKQDYLFKKSQVIECVVDEYATSWLQICENISNDLLIQEEPV